MSSTALLLRMRQRVGQRLQDRARAGGLRRPCRGRPGGAYARAPARARAGRRAVRHRRAASRRGSPARRRAARPADADARSACGERRKALARHPGLVLPFRQLGQARQRAVHRAPDIAEREAFGERIDRLDQRQRGKALLIDHAVGMHHLQHAVVEFGGAGDVARLADRQQLFQIVLARAEIGQRQREPVSSLVTMR